MSSTSRKSGQDGMVSSQSFGQHSQNPPLVRDIFEFRQTSRGIQIHQVSENGFYIGIARMLNSRRILGKQPFPLATGARLAVTVPFHFMLGKTEESKYQGHLQRASTRWSLSNYFLWTSPVCAEIILKRCYPNCALCLVSASNVLSWDHWRTVNISWSMPGLIWKPCVYPAWSAFRDNLSTLKNSTFTRWTSTTRYWTQVTLLELSLDWRPWVFCKIVMQNLTDTHVSIPVKSVYVTSCPHMYGLRALLTLFWQVNRCEKLGQALQEKLPNLERYVHSLRCPSVVRRDIPVLVGSRRLSRFRNIFRLIRAKHPSLKELVILISYGYLLRWQRNTDQVTVEKHAVNDRSAFEVTQITRTQVVYRDNRTLTKIREDERS